MVYRGGGGSPHTFLRAIMAGGKEHQATKRVRTAFSTAGDEANCVVKANRQDKKVAIPRGLCSTDGRQTLVMR